ncbi:MAG: alanine racemase [Candidatus Doudnabacteria bacterium]|nr:alanine racemase [Candidatus Doudnabacteria bacterium]
MLDQVLISKSALIHNAKQFKQVLKKAKLMAVVKSNAKPWL